MGFGILEIVISGLVRFKTKYVSLKFHAVLVNLVHYITGLRLWLNERTFPKISCYAASAPHLQQLPMMTQSKMSLWQASLCKVQVSSLPCQPSLSQPACPCPACCCCCCCRCCSPTFLSVFGFVLLLQPVWLSVFLYAGWLHLQDYLASSLCLFLNPDIKADVYGAICCSLNE